MKDKCGVGNCTKSVRASMGDLKYLSHKDLLLSTMETHERLGTRDHKSRVTPRKEKYASCVLVRVKKEGKKSYSNKKWFLKHHDGLNQHYTDCMEGIHHHCLKEKVTGPRNRYILQTSTLFPIT